MKVTAGEVGILNKAENIWRQRCQYVELLDTATTTRGADLSLWVSR